MTAPTVGRQVWYHTGLDDPARARNGQPLAATVAYVWSDTCVNLCVIDADGNPYSRTSVVFVHGDEAVKPNHRWCEWPARQEKQNGKK